MAWSATADETGCVEKSARANRLNSKHPFHALSYEAVSCRIHANRADGSPRSLRQ